MKIGLFFGSFNPIHNGHLILASTICQEAKLDKVWFVVSPQNPFKSLETLLHEQDRYDMVRLALHDDPQLDVSDIEFNLPKPSYTVHTLVALAERYPSYKFSLIMGEDNFKGIHKWKNYQYILDDHEVIVYPRQGFSDVDYSQFKSLKVINAPFLNISATYIRARIKNGHHINYLVPKEVQDLISRKGWYRI